MLQKITTNSSNLCATFFIEYLNKRKNSSILRSYLAHFLAQAQKIKKSTPKKFLIFREVELSSPNIIKFLVFSYILGNEIFQPKLEKKMQLEKVSCTSGKWSFLTLILKKLLKGCLKRKLLLCFRKRKPRKNPCIFSREGS